ncbi:hypothetical protein Vadar_013744 [Vaccinium darrowii]|uniref:Uncharacterized protein n=1 Tax=Vaccinium darrowii TaxID=229202 RepID=A0ACB7XHM9_9ERIC|nr:hypothetical protein Vadar_013744 [Vaccinium darrowii]
MKERGCQFGSSSLPFAWSSCRGFSNRPLLSFKVFNGFKTAIRTRGGDIKFDEVVTMLNSEDLQLIQEGSLESDVSTVLVATSSGNTTASECVTGSHTNGQQSQFDSSQQTMNPYLPQQQFYQQNNRNGNRNRGYRGGRLYRDPCAICGRNNHLTDFCYYKNGNGYQASPTFPGSNFAVVPNGSWSLTPWVHSSVLSYNGPMQQPGFASSNVRGFTQGSQRQIIPSGSSGHGNGYGTAGYGNNFTIGAQAQSSSHTQTQAQAHFTGGFTVPYMVHGQSQQQQPVFFSSPQSFSAPQSVPAQQFATTTPSNAPQWYLDSGATHHITNSMQNLDIAQPASPSDGIIVGNGSTLQKARNPFKLQSSNSGLHSPDSKLDSDSESSLPVAGASEFQADY